MNIEELRIQFISRPGVTESFPFDETTLVFKVMNKMFGLVSLERTPTTMNLKCDPELAIQLREEFECVNPGYHMSKKHWNTVTVDGSVSDELYTKWIDLSYDLVVSGLTKKLKEELNSLSEKE